MKDFVTRNWCRGCIAVLAFSTALQVGGTALAHERVVQGFTDTGSSGANGRVRFSLRNDADGRLELRVRGLAPDQSFDVLAGSVLIGTLHTTGGGSGALRFRSRPRGRDVLLGFDPRGALITIRDANGTDVLVATVPTTPNSADPTKVACCKSDDGGTECEDRTVEQCMADGGVPAAAASCLPNPCDNVQPPVTKIICCEPDDGGAECEDRSMADCAARGGTVVEAASCTPNPCVGVPPADGDIQCCLPDDNGSECEDRTPTQCAAQGGTNMGPGTCTPNPCAAVPPADGDIQCCLPDDSGSECEDRTPEQCAAQGGTNMGPGTCTPNPCAVATTPTPGGDDRGGGGSAGTYYGVPVAGGDNVGGHGRRGH